jgi:hypothetical protein
MTLTSGPRAGFDDSLRQIAHHTPFARCIQLLDTNEMVRDGSTPALLAGGPSRRLLRVKPPKRRDRLMAGFCLAAVVPGTGVGWQPVAISGHSRVGEIER